MKLLRLIPVIVLFVSCEEAIQLIELDKSWEKSKVKYLRNDNYPDFYEITPHDTINYKEFLIQENYEKTFSDSLRIKKVIVKGSKNRIKLFETDIYLKKLNRNCEVQLSLSYDYNLQEFKSWIIDSIGTEEKMKENQDSLLRAANYAKENNLILCGTAQENIIWKDVPYMPIDREFEIDSAKILITKWK